MAGLGLFASTVEFLCDATLAARVLFFTFYKTQQACLVIVWVCKAAPSIPPRIACLTKQELRVIVASATLDAEKFRDFFESNRCAE